MEETKNEIDTRTEKIKKHFQANWETYAIAAASFAAGIIVGGSFVLRRRNMIVGESEIAEVLVKNINCDIKYQTISKYGHKIGHPGNTIREITEGVMTPDFESQTLAALDAGVTYGMMRRHLNGELPDLNGRKFIKVER